MRIQVGVIGLGNRLSGLLGTLHALGMDVCVSCVADPDTEGALERLARSGIPAEGVRLYPDADALLSAEKPDGLMIGTRCNLHAVLANKVIGRGIPLFLEKPVFMDEAGESLLTRAQARQNAPVIVSFPLRMTQMARAARDIVANGTLGPLSLASGITTVNYARGYYKKWYRDASITGGMFLQKATHDLDLIFYLTGAAPLSLCAMESRAVMGGDMPAGISCDECPKRFSCPESDWTLERVYHEPPQPHACSFGSDIHLQDAGSVLIALDNGAHASYTQSFVARKSANRRATRLVGLKATLDLDFTTGKIHIFHHTVSRVDTYDFTDTNGHFGGDAGLMSAFVRLMRGENCEYPTLTDGLVSARACLRAQQSAERKQYLDCR